MLTIERKNRPALLDGHFSLSDTLGLGWVLDPTFIKRYRIDD